MDSKLNSLLYRILKDRLWVSVNGLSFFIIEPTLDLLEESWFIYKQAYDKAYADDNLTQDELTLFLIDQDIWSPYDERILEEKRKELDNAKVDAFQLFFKSKELRSAKFKIKRINNEISKMISRKHGMDYLSCEGVAEQSRFNWIISKSCFHENGTPVNWSVNNLSSFINAYRENFIDHADFRKIARNDPWRSMWSLSKRGGLLFNEPATLLSSNKLTLCSYSSMYDSVYENPEAPSEKIIEDDDCLDGWFIAQRRKHEQSRKERESEELIKNPKIKNAKEVFLMANNKQEADEIYGLNNGLARSVINQRQQTIEQKGKTSDLDFVDVQTDLQMQQNQAFISKVRGK